MKRTRTKTLLAALITTAAFGAISSANAALIDNSGITATASSQFNGNTGPEKTLGSGLNTSFDPAQHSNGSQASWLSGGNAADQWIQWDLGQSYTLDSIRVWNYNRSSFLNNGINQLDIYISSLASPGDPEGAGSGDWTLWAEDATFSSGTAASDYVGFDLETEVGGTLPTTAIRWVRFEVDSKQGANTVFGDSSALADIQFSGTPVPEPGSLALMGLGGLCLIRRRRA